MTGEAFNQAEADRLLGEQVVRAQAIGTIFDNAIAVGDRETMDRILNTYPRGYLDFILGGYPDYLKEFLED